MAYRPFETYRRSRRSDAPAAGSDGALIAFDGRLDNASESSARSHRQGRRPATSSCCSRSIVSAACRVWRSASATSRWRYGIRPRARSCCAATAWDAAAVPIASLATPCSGRRAHAHSSRRGAPIDRLRSTLADSSRTCPRCGVRSRAVNRLTGGHAPSSSRIARRSSATGRSIQPHDPLSRRCDYEQHFSELFQTRSRAGSRLTARSSRS